MYRHALHAEGHRDHGSNTWTVIAWFCSKAVNVEALMPINSEDLDRLSQLLESIPRVEEVGPPGVCSYVTATVSIVIPRSLTVGCCSLYLRCPG